MFRSTLSRRAFSASLSTLPLAAATSRTFAQDATPEAVSLLRNELPSGGVQADGSWQFTDDRGVTQMLDAMPEVVVAHIGVAAALYDYGYTVSGFFGTAEDENGDPLPVAGNFPYKDVTNLGETGEIDLETLISMGTQVFIGPTFDLSLPLYIWPVDDEALARIDENAKVIEITYADGTNIKRTIESIANLAAALGADLSTPEVADAIAEFEAVSDEMRANLTAKPDLVVAFITGSSTGFYESRPLADLEYFVQLGMTILEPKTGAEQNWEVFGTVEADFLYIDEREPRWFTREHLLEDVPVFGMHPAVAAGNMANWTNVYVPSYVGYTPILKAVSDAVVDADETIF